MGRDGVKAPDPSRLLGPPLRLLRRSLEGREGERVDAADDEVLGDGVAALCPDVVEVFGDSLS